MQEVSSGHWERARMRALRRNLARSRAREERMPRVGDTVGGFLLEARLGAGSFGTVFRARQGARLFALKLLYLPMAGAWAWRELEVLLRLHRVGLLGVECHGHHGPEPEVGPLFLYIVTDYVPGEPMDAWAEHTNPTARQVTEAVLVLAAQLALAHSVGVVHRDVKPDNVVVRGQDKKPVLVDFGVGTFPGALKVSGGSPPGSALARSPEVWRFLREHPGAHYEATARDDLWALGVLLYWLLVGDWPFEGETPGELADAVLHAAPEAPHARNPRVPEALSAVCLRMLEKAPEVRLADAEAVCEAVEKVLAGADAAWDVPLCDAWDESRATTVGEGKRSWGQMAAREQRLEGARPLRGRPPTPPDDALPFALEDVPFLDEGAFSLGIPAEAPAEEQPERRRRLGAWGLGALALLCAVHLCAPRAEDVRVPAGQEMAPREWSLEGDAGAVTFGSSTPAPVAFATPLEEGIRVKTSRKNTPHPEQTPRERSPAGRSVSKALCFGALGTLVAGCSGAPVRANPPPEACPAGALDSMAALGIRMGQEGTVEIPPMLIVDDTKKLAGIHEGEARLLVFDTLGQLKRHTYLKGRFIFGKERVSGRLYEAEEPGGARYPVCVELWEFGDKRGRGLVPEADSPPGTAKVFAYPTFRVVARFE